MPSVRHASATPPLTAGQLNQQFDELLEADAASTEQQAHELSSACLVRGCRYGDGSLPTFLKPDLITQAELVTFQRAIPRIMRCVEKLLHHARADAQRDPDRPPMLVRQLNEATRRFALLDPGMPHPLVISRLDGFQGATDLRFLEFNVDSPAGIAYADVVERELLRTPIVRLFAEQHKLIRTSRRRLLMRALLAAHQSWRDQGHGRRRAGSSTGPTVAILDLPDVPTCSEFDLLAHYFHQHGLPTVIGDPRELVLSRGRLVLRGVPIDIVYRRMLVPECGEHHDDLAVLYEAAARQLACVVNPFCARLASSKSILGMLTDPAYEPLFTPRERESIAQHIPWTRRLALAFVDYHGETHDIVSLVRDRRGEFVLKPIDSHGGHHVFIGRETDPGAWDHVLHTALLRGDFIVQEYLPIPQKRVPVLDADGMRLVRKKVNINPFCFGGQYGGSLARVSDSSVINVKLGGGILATVPVV